MMEVSIIRPTEVSSYLVNALELDTVTGNRVVLPGHAPAFFVLAQNTKLLLTLAENKTELIYLPGGLVEVQRTLVRILVDE